MFTRSVLTLGVCCAISTYATTLEQLSVDDMIQKSTTIMRATVTGTYTASRAGNIWTFYRLQVLENWKPSNHSISEVAVPGGAADGIRQTVAGAPELVVGHEYVMFVWIGPNPSGLPQLMGLSQGLFSVTKDTAGNALVSRPAASERMLDRQGGTVNDRPIGMTIVNLRDRVRAEVHSRATGAGK